MRTSSWLGLLLLGVLATACSGVSTDPRGGAVLGSVVVTATLEGCDPVESIDLDVGRVTAVDAGGVEHELDPDVAVTVTCTDRSATIATSGAGLPVGTYVEVKIEVLGGTVHLADGREVPIPATAVALPGPFDVADDGNPETVELRLPGHVQTVGGVRLF